MSIAVVEKRLTRFQAAHHDHALSQGARPEIFHTDQGVQCTRSDFTGLLQHEGMQISMDGRGRALDNVLVERLWRTVTYEEVYLKDSTTVREARQGLAQYFTFYNHERLHQALGSQTPAAVYHCKRGTQ